MKRDRLTAAIKTRVTEATLAALEEQALARHLELSDVVREAFREYLERHPHQNGHELTAVPPAAAA